MIEYYNIEQMLCFDFEQKKRIDFIIWVQSSAKNEFTYVISEKQNRSRISYLRLRIINNKSNVTFIFF